MCFSGPVYIYTRIHLVFLKYEFIKLLHIQLPFVISSKNGSIPNDSNVISFFLNLIGFLLEMQMIVFDIKIVERIRVPYIVNY